MVDRPRDRRVLLGAGALLAGLSTAIISGTAVAAADTGDTDSQPADSTSAASAQPNSPTRASGPRRAAARAKVAGAAAAASTDDAPRTGRGARVSRAGASNARTDRQRNSAPAAVAETAQTPTTPAAAAAVSDTTPAAPESAPVVNPITTVHTVYSTPNGPAVESVATTAPAARAAASAAPIRTFLNSVVTALGWGPAGPAAAAAPALAAFTGQRQSAGSAAVIGSPVVAGASPDPAALDPKLPEYTNGVTGVQVGHSRLEMPGAFIGKTVAADWYFPTQVDGTVAPQGVIWLQHGFGATNTFYSALAQDLAMKTNSIVVAPNLSSIPFPISGGCLTCAGSEEAAAALFLDPNRTTLIDSALAAGYTGDVDQLKGRFAFAGHSAGGGFSAAAASDYIDNGTDLQDGNLIGVVMFDGVSNGALTGAFTKQVQTLNDAGKPIYTIAAPAQSWNAFGATTNALVNALPGEFAGVVLSGGSHVDSMLGVNPIFDAILQLVTKRVPAGNTAATHLLSAGWINDLYGGWSPNFYNPNPDMPPFGIYAGANEAIIMGPTSALGLPSPVENQLAGLDKLIVKVLGLFGIDVTGPIPTSTDNGVDGVLTPVLSNGVTGVRTGSAVLNIPSGNGYAAPSDWYFPTQSDGTVEPNGMIWLQHGFLGFKSWYADMAYALAQETNSIVVVPQINWFNDAFSGQAAAQMFVGDRSALNVSANLAGLQGTLPEKFILTGHSAGGNFATVAGAGTVDNGAYQNLLGVVMFDGVSFPGVFGPAIAKLDSTGIPDYQIAATPQSWNAWGQTTQELALLHPDQWIGTLIDNGSHTDSVEGPSFFAFLAEIASNILVRKSPPGGKEAVRTFATGWVNDLYSGVYGPDNPYYGIYDNPNDGSYVPDQRLVMGEAGATTLPAPPPVNVDRYSGTWYEQGSVRQFFSVGLVNTTATYTPQSDGSIKVENAGQYFGPNGPAVNIVGAAVSTNSPTNTQLNVGFGKRPPKPRVPGNYWIMDYAPDYSWAIVSGPNLRSGYILTRDQTITEDEYNALVARAEQLGVTGNIRRTKQYPPSSAAALPGPAVVPATVAL